MIRLVSLDISVQSICEWLTALKNENGLRISWSPLALKFNNLILLCQ